MKTHYHAGELAGLPGLPGSEQNCRARAHREGWPKRRRQGRGGGWEYPITCLPAETRDHLASELLKSTGRQCALSQQRGADDAHIRSAAHRRDDGATRSVEHGADRVPADVPAGRRSDGLRTTGFEGERPSGRVSVRPAGAVAADGLALDQLKDWQRATVDARAAIIQELNRCAILIGQQNAIHKFVGLAAAGELPPHLQSLIPVANQKCGSESHRTFCERTLKSWLAKYREQGLVGLAPKARDTHKVPPWAPALLSLYQQPQKPALTTALDQLPKVLPRGITPPSYSAARRFLEKMGNVEVQKGRMLPRELSKLKPYVVRDVSDLRPGDVYTADGHTFDAEVAHPQYGGPFRPEITGVLDVRTKKLVGWSAGLAESTWTVLDAWRHAVETHGINAIFYVDNGAGFKNFAMTSDVTGFAARLGAEITHSRPYNSQARGAMERSHQTIWVNAAKTLPTYMGKDMDPEAKQRVFKITRREVKETGKARWLISWPKFLELCAESVDHYNNAPHSSLPKVRNAAGRLEHQTPNEAWAQHLGEGFEPHLVTKDEAVDLFRPRKQCKVTRGMVRLFNNSYFSLALQEYHGDTVTVGYDIHDASHVWVRDLEGRLICVAEFEGNKTSYFPQAFVDHAREKRAIGRARRLEAKLEEVRDELEPPAPTADVVEPPQLELEPAQDIRIEVPANVVEMPVSRARPMFYADDDKYQWLLEHADQVTAEDETWLAWFKTTGYYRDIYGSPPVFRTAGD